MYGEQAADSRPRYDRTHPGFHLNVSMESNGAPLEYRRETNLETGEISVFWTDIRGNWVRRIFVSRTHSAASQGNLPEAINTYTSFLERYVEHWRENAKELYGCRGVVTDLCQGWRHGAVLMATYPWTGGAGWLAHYLYDHYLFTQDREFLFTHVVPLLRDVADFYEDFLQKYPEKNGRLVFYPSISPENEPVMIPADQTTNVVPNAIGTSSLRPREGGGGSSFPRTDPCACSAGGSVQAPGLFLTPQISGNPTSSPMSPSQSS